ncbi:MAG: L,D-transpeptidase, partial [Cyanobium sp.]
MPRPVNPSPLFGVLRRSSTVGAIGALLTTTVLVAGARGAAALETPPPPPPPLAPAIQATPGSGPGVAINPPPATTTSLASTRQIVLELGKRTISLIEGDKVLGRWPVAVGDPSTPTPTGTFAVRNKVVNP